MHLTTSGRDLVESLLPQVFELLKGIFSRLTEEEKEILIHLLAKVQLTTAELSPSGT